MDKINRPDMVRIIGPQPDNLGIMVVEPLATLMASGKLQTLFPPYPLDLLVVDQEAFSLQKLMDLAISISAILLGQPDHS
jgi:hypothetical protein